MNAPLKVPLPVRAVIPIAKDRTLDSEAIARQGAPDGAIVDTLGRRLHDLRISVTDRCNFRCTYCMPKDVFDRNHEYLPHRDLLTFEEIARLVRVFVAHGVEKVRLTGGEPLLRKDLERLVAMLAEIELPGRPGRHLDLTLTTNGSLLRRKAQVLRDAGLSRLTVSLDALDDARFRAMNDVDFPVADVLDGLTAAREAGFDDVKVNMVVKRGVNDDQVEPMAEHFRATGQTLRFIEFMDVGHSNQWQSADVVPTTELVERISARWPIESVDASYRGEVAERWRYRDGAGEVGFISSVTQPFCADCSRARVSPEGRVYTCLFASSGTDLRRWLRDGADDAQLARVIGAVWTGRDDRYSELRGSAAGAATRRIEMSYIGG
jgi:cyclic pyranopterin phosphate synthase